jgi:hypothetical protein
MQQNHYKEKIGDFHTLFCFGLKTSLLKGTVEKFILLGIAFMLTIRHKKKGQLLQACPFST